ncbi:hypothetical protein K432DRAFT_448394 [Lepidopterella palustris CBS 459.81]|uniref:Uncharacterized protein n=1 Tax=Lepidopterella palustris CBS 459.81 TaxID=1314670 RepID=A0A8E2ELL1_9PEZI|nr:hypothetical protein K432DRAFT_448394 [Lepidopterella palustris CBS 459.81]
MPVIPQLSVQRSAEPPGKLKVAGRLTRTSHRLDSTIPYPKLFLPFLIHILTSTSYLSPQTRSEVSPSITSAVAVDLLRHVELHTIGRCRRGSRPPNCSTQTRRQLHYQEPTDTLESTHAPRDNFTILRFSDFPTATITENEDSMPFGTYAKVHRDHLSIDALTYHDIPYEYDGNDGEDIIILRKMDPKESGIILF